jgi:hypothetical protein
VERRAGAAHDEMRLFGLRDRLNQEQHELFGGEQEHVAGAPALSTRAVVIKNLVRFLPRPALPRTTLPGRSRECIQVSFSHAIRAAAVAMLQRLSAASRPKSRWECALSSAPPSKVPLSMPAAQ